MSKPKYAMVKDDKGFISNWDPMSGKFTFTDNIDSAILYTSSGIEEHLSFLERHDIDLVPVRVLRVITGDRKRSADFLDKVLDRLQKEFDELDQNDVDDLNEHDFRRWKRLKRQLDTRTIDNSKIT